MKIIFTSPFNPLWSKSVSEIASHLDAKVVSIGDLLRAEEKNNSYLWKEIKVVFDSGELLKTDLVCELLSRSFFDNPESEILVNFPTNKTQAESLAKYLKNSIYSLTACIVVNTDKESIREKFKSQYHCRDSFHTKLETSLSNPMCEECGEPMIHSYDLKNDKVAHLIDSYFDANGVLSGVSTLSRNLCIESIDYTTPEKVVSQIQGLNHEIV